MEAEATYGGRADAGEDLLLGPEAEGDMHTGEH